MKLDLQSWTKYLWNFSRFSIVSLHHKWNATRILSLESECPSCFMSGWETKDLGIKIPEKPGFDVEYPAGHQKNKFWQLC